MVKPEIYDMFEIVFGLMITVKNESIKKLTKEIVLNFIQNFPLSEQLLEKILLRMINNLDFAEAEGRTTVLNVFERLFEKLPIEAFKDQLDLIIMAFTARLVNEEVNHVSAYCSTIFKHLIEKINAEDEFRPALTKMFDNCLVWLRDENEGTKRAGIQLLRVLFWATGDYARIEETVEDMVCSLGVICEDIVTFWENFKTDEDLKEILKENQWKDIMIDEDTADPENPMATVKSTKLVVVDYLNFAEIVICHDKTRGPAKSELLGVLLKLSRHPDEEVQLSILNILRKFMETAESKPIVKEHLKSVLIFLFALLKSKHLKEEICLQLNDCFKGLIMWFFTEIPKLLSMILTAISNIAFKYLRFSARYMYITSKCISVVRSLNSILTPPLTSEDTRKLAEIYVRLLDHGSIRDDKETVDLLESVDLWLCRISWISAIRLAASTSS